MENKKEEEEQTPSLIPYETKHEKTKEAKEKLEEENNVIPNIVT